MNWRSKTLVIGGVVGGVIGLLAAWLYIQTAEEERTAALRDIPKGKMVRLGLSVLEMLRQVTSLGKPEEEGRRRGRLRKIG